MRSNTLPCSRGISAILSISFLITFSSWSIAGGAEPPPTTRPALITPHPAPPAAPDTTTLVGKPAPEFSLPTLDKHQVKLAGQKGKVVMLDFWATWCPPCRASLPHVQHLASDQERLKKGLVVWVVNDKEDEPTVQKFLKENSYGFTVPMDTTAAVLKQYLVRGIPTTVIVGRDGVIRKVFIGYGPDTAPQIDKAVDEALAEGAMAAAN